ncbi:MULTISPECIES: nucleotide sugar dehydrogenase [Streptomyces]|uniref:nucleotide sugar dehydrogenase n=1 Tax=Streptomyces TaxID=1883 RepID=UPI000BF04B6A|nr:nucleotide sugar dehydrogenase [Streptomyces sp. ms184]
MDQEVPEELCVWGLGLIGYTLAGELCRTGRRCLVVDIDPQRVALLNRGEIPFSHLPDLLQRYDEEVRRGLLRATSVPEDALTPEHTVHLLCIPTEADGAIDSSALRSVITALATGSSARPLFVIIESTIAPQWLDSLLHPLFAAAGMTHGVDYHVGASPRRDWLIDHQRTMASIPKIIGGGSPEVISLMRDLYSPICAEVIEAPDARHAAMVKVVENYFRYRSILAASELGIMLPDYDVAEILRLASSKWTMNLYHPSFGIGGYCVPLAKDYLGTEPGAREVTLELGRIEEATYSRIRQELSKHGPLEKVAVLGISYMPGMKIHTRSPSLRLIQELKEHGAEVYVHDPLYSPEEVVQKTGGKALNFPLDLAHCDSVILMVGHACYRAIDHPQLLKTLRTSARIFDNLGIWSGRDFAGDFQYVEVGGAGYFTGDTGPARHA